MLAKGRTWSGIRILGKCSVQGLVGGRRAHPARCSFEASHREVDIHNATCVIDLSLPILRVSVITLAV